MKIFVTGGSGFVSLPRRYRIDIARRELGFAPQAVMAQMGKPGSSGQTATTALRMTQ